jgi:hypothetical protein
VPRCKLRSRRHARWLASSVLRWRAMSFRRRSPFPNPPLLAIVGIAVAVCTTRNTRAQHQHEDREPSAEETKTADAEHQARAGMDHTEMNHMDQEHARLMKGPLGVSRSRLGSGTSWLPDSSPMHGLMASLGEGGFMFHENIFAGYDWFGSDRGSKRFVSVSSVMGMAWYPLGPGELMARLMLSAEPATVGKRGYPLILQTGETANDQPLHDRQHAHDLLMEVALQYTFVVKDAVGIELYIAPAGEPALGPTAYPHRVSAISDPLAPIGHHWQDSTHIAFGVLTAAVFTRRLKLEGSWFNGREPDESRWDLDLRKPDSFAARLTWNPNDDLSFQGSYGYLASPERQDTSVSAHRATASATYNRPLHAQANWATTFVFGENVESKGPATPSFLLESNFDVDGHSVIFGRAEYVRKAGHDLVLPPEREDSVFGVALVGLGYAYYFGPFASLAPGLGVRGGAGVVDDELEPFYGTRAALGIMVFPPQLISLRGETIGAAWAWLARGVTCLYRRGFDRRG